MFGSRFCIGQVNAMRQSTDDNRTLYFWQGVACLSVVLIHCMLPTSLGVAACALARFAVPLFFMTSGYYLRRGDMTDAQVQERICQKVRRFGGLLLGWALFYLAWTLLRAYASGGAAGVQSELSDIFTIRHMLAMLLLNDFTDIGGHLWFIAALLCCYELFRHAGCKWLDKCGGSIAVILLCVHIVGRGVLAALSIDDIGGIPAYLWLRNGAFMGLPFVALGDWIRRNQARLTERLTQKNLMLMLIGGAVLTVIEAGIVQKLTGDDRELYLGTLLMVAAVFLMAVKNPTLMPERGLAKLAKYDARTFYLIHLWVIDALGIAMARAGLKSPIAVWLKPFAVMAASVGISVTWRKCKTAIIKARSAQ